MRLGLITENLPGSPAVRAGRNGRHWAYRSSWYAVSVRMAYKCRAYPDADQRQVLARTFGCVRVVWNRTLADRHTPHATEGKSTSYAQTDAALTAMKKTPEPRVAERGVVGSVAADAAAPVQGVQRVLRERSRYPRFKSRQAAVRDLHPVGVPHGGRALWLAKTTCAARSLCGRGRTLTRPPLTRPRSRFPATRRTLVRVARRSRPPTRNTSPRRSAS